MGLRCYYLDKFARESGILSVRRNGTHVTDGLYEAFEISLRTANNADIGQRCWGEPVDFLTDANYPGFEIEPSTATAQEWENKRPAFQLVGPR